MTRSFRPKIQLAALITASAVALLLPTAGSSALDSTAQTAHQTTAYGCALSAWGPDTYCVYLSGSGTYVSSVAGNFNGGGFVCNWYVTAEFFDVNWRWYQTLSSPTHSGCTNSSGDLIRVNANKANGFMCSTLRYYDGLGTYRNSSVCHRIHS